MACYNGLVATTNIAGTTGFVGGTSLFTVVAAVPAKFFQAGQFAVNVTGISGNFGVQIFGGVGGATFLIAGRTNISATGGFPVPLVAYVGTSGAVQNFGIPRPTSIAWQGSGLTVGTTNQMGLTASVFLAADYN